MRNLLKYFPLLILFMMSLALVQKARAQEPIAYYDYVRSDLDWYTIETEHFLVHYHAGENGEGSRTARVVSRIAEDVFEPITSLYDYRPDTKVSFILKDFEDYSNGAAYFFDNMIEIWSPALQTTFRGDHNWLRNVITHEFTHMVQVQKTMKASRRLPFFYLQYLDYEEVLRPDVLYGFPNIIASYAVPVLNNPAWLAEGTAQFQRDWLDYDRWDAQRDMLLRTQVLAGEQLTLEEMGGFYSHNSLMRESVYNHGFAFTRYLADRFGEDGLRTLSVSLGQWGNSNFEQATKEAFGIRGEELYADWMATLSEHYSATRRDSHSSPEILESEGFHNYYPRFSPDGSRLVYLSNKGQDYSRTSVWIKDLTEESTAELILDDAILGPRLAYTCSLGHRVVSAASGSVAWTRDGKSLIYSKTRDTPTGHLYLDLYRYDISAKKSKRLTKNQRASHPAMSPDGKHIAFIQQGDGTTNIWLAPYESSETETLSASAVTKFADGSQVSDPVFSPSGEWIYFGFSNASGNGHGRDVYRIRPSGEDLEVVLANEWDERTPGFDVDGNLLFASDKTGIFNLYRYRDGEDAVAVTDESGGAFMPNVSTSGRLAYSRYEASGYKIASEKRTPNSASPLPYEAPDYLIQFDITDAQTGRQKALNDADDSDIRAFSAQEWSEEAAPYKPVFTSFSFLPVLRLDQYVSKRRSRADIRLKDRSRGETLWRNTKVGLYAGTREVLGGLSFFGGLLIGPGSGSASTPGDFLAPSNLLDLERDAFLQVDYARGLPFLKKRWSPQLSVQLFNIRRNVESGLTIEEFPCTACFPETTTTDLSYNLWQVDFLAKNKLNRVMLLESGYRYSPYRVKTKSFFSRELGLSVPSSSSRYYIGRAYHTRLIFESFAPHRDMNVVPHGLRAELGIDSERGRLLDNFEVEDGILSPVYERSTVNRVTLTARGGMKLGGWPGEGVHGVGFRMRASTILGGEKDDFYNDYVGGLTGARGYPFYAMGGNETLWFQVSYLFPVLPRINKQFLFTYIDKMYLRLYADAAWAWSDEWPGVGGARKDAGAEIRFGLGSYYILPTAFFISGTYGLDEFEFQLDDGFVTPDGEQFVQYGKSWQWHVGVLFGFDQF